MGKPMNGKHSSARHPARERLLAAAEELFYQQGVQSVGIDKIIERAGVAKASLYSNFKSKDELVRAYLEARHEARRVAIETNVALHRTPRAKLLSVFDSMAGSLAKPNYRGCAFLRATAEMPDDAIGRRVCQDSRRWTRELLSSLAREAGATNPDALAKQLLLLYDGAAASAQMDGATGAAAAAKAAAALLIDAACKRSGRT